MKLSIIVTTYNIEKYIEKCLLSIIEQSLNDIEIIVVDDASTDGTRDIIARLAQTDKRIRTIFFDANTIGGVASAANAGMEIAQGEYIGFADGDDWYEPFMFERLYANAASNEADIALCNYRVFDQLTEKYNSPSDENKWARLPSFFDGRKNDTDGDEPDKIAFLLMNPVPWRKIYRKGFIDRYAIRFPVGDYFFEDNPFHWQAVIAAKCIVSENFIGCYHRLNRTGQSMASAGDRLLGMYDHHATILSILEQQGRLADYKKYALRWLVGSTSWITAQIERQFLEVLFCTLQKELSRYDSEFIDEIIASQFLGKKSIKIIHSLQSANITNFIKTVQPAVFKENKRYYTSPRYKISFFLKYQGMKAFLQKLHHFAASRIRPSQPPKPTMPEL